MKNFKLVFMGLREGADKKSVILLIKRLKPTATNQELINIITRGEHEICELSSKEKIDKLSSLLSSKGAIVRTEDSSIEFSFDEITIENHIENQTSETQAKTESTPAYDAADISPISRRFMAFSIDFVLIAIACTTVLYLTSSLSLHLTNNAYGVSALIFVFYFSYFNSSLSQGTFGQRFIGQRVVRPDNNELSLAQSFGRTAIFTLTGGTAAIPALFTTQKMGGHDLAFKTTVVRSEASKSLLASNEKAVALAKANLNKAQAFSEQKIANFATEINNSIPILERAGYTVHGMEADVKIPPSITLLMEMSRTISEEELVKIEQEVKDKPATLLLLNTMRTACNIQRKVNIRSLKSSGVEITLGITPSAKLIFERNRSV